MFRQLVGFSEGGIKWKEPSERNEKKKSVSQASLILWPSLDLAELFIAFIAVSLSPNDYLVNRAMILNTLSSVFLDVLGGNDEIGWALEGSKWVFRA